METETKEKEKRRVIVEKGRPEKKLRCLWMKVLESPPRSGITAMVKNLVKKPRVYLEKGEEDPGERRRTR